MSDAATKPTPGTISEKAGKFDASINVDGKWVTKSFDTSAAAAAWLEGQAESARKKGLRVYSSARDEPQEAEYRAYAQAQGLPYEEPAEPEAHGRFVYRDTGVTKVDADACPLEPGEFATTSEYVAAVKDWSEKHGAATYSEREPDDLPRELVELVASTLGVNPEVAGGWLLYQEIGSSPEGRAAAQAAGEQDGLGAAWERWDV